MFSPDPNKAQEPAFLPHGASLYIRLSSSADRAPDENLNGSITGDIFNAKAIRWRAERGEAKVAFNQNPYNQSRNSGLPSPYEAPLAKYFKAASGEFAINSQMKSVCFTADGPNVVLYLEVM